MITVRALFALVLTLSMIAGAPALAHDPVPRVAGHAIDDVQEEAVEAARVVDAFHTALEHGDTEGTLALLAEDVLIFESGDAERSRDEYAEHHLAADAAFSAAGSPFPAGTASWAQTMATSRVLEKEIKRRRMTGGGGESGGHQFVNGAQRAQDFA